MMFSGQGLLHFYEGFVVDLADDGDLVLLWVASYHLVTSG